MSSLKVFTTDSIRSFRCNIVSFSQVSTVLFTVLIYVIAEDAKPIATATEGHNDKGFFQYANVPVPNEYVFGYNRDSDLHQISRFQQVKDRTFQTKVCFFKLRGNLPTNCLIQGEMV